VPSSLNTACRFTPGANTTEGIGGFDMARLNGAGHCSCLRPVRPPIVQPYSLPPKAHDGLIFAPLAPIPTTSPTAHRQTLPKTTTKVQLTLRIMWRGAAT
jgi:hypothetical protein